jgi:hypothetical protein
MGRRRDEAFGLLGRALLDWSRTSSSHIWEETNYPPRLALCTARFVEPGRAGLWKWIGQPFAPSVPEELSVTKVAMEQIPAEVEYLAIKT